MNNWISVEDQPLPKDRKVLAYSKTRGYAVVWHLDASEYIYYDPSENPDDCGDNPYVDKFPDITHWQDLPEAPK